MLKELFNPANYFFNLWAIPSITVGIYCFILGIFAWLKNKKIQGFSLFVFTFSIGVWLLTYGLMYLSSNAYTGFLWSKISHIVLGVNFISTNNYFFTLTVTGRLAYKKEKIFLGIGYFLMMVFTLLVIFTDLILEYPPYRYVWGYYANVGRIYILYLAIWGAYALRNPYMVYNAWKKEENPLEKKRLKTYLISYSIGYVAAFDYLGGFGIALYPFGYIFIATYLTILTYNIIKYRALEFETVIHKTILWIVTVLFVVLPAGVIGFFILRKSFAYFHPLLNIFLFSLMLVCFAYYYFYLRPKIDSLFGRKEFTQYEVLGRIAKEVSTTLDVKELNQRLFNELTVSIYPQRIFLWLSDVQKQHFSLYSKKTSQQVEFLQGQQFSLSLNDRIPRHLNNTKGTLEILSVSLNPQLQYLQESPYFGLLKEQEIELLVPLSMEDDLIGILGLGKKQSLRLYTLKDIETFTTLGKELGSLLYNAIHHKDVVEKERLDEEMKMGRQIQMSLLPRETPQVPGLDIEGLMLPAKEIGGDYYDFIVLPNKENLAVIIGDVSGKGVSAGLIMSLTKATIHNLSEEGFSPKEILLRTNRFLNKQIGGQKFMTLLYLLWQSSTRTLTYSSAGHEHILIYRNQGPATTGNVGSATSGGTAARNQVETILSGGFMLGMIPDIDKFLEERQIKLESGDKILLYTDGVTEAESASGDRFGLERLIESFQKYSQKPAQELMQAVKDDVYAFIGTYPQYDDITLVVMEAV